MIVMKFGGTSVQDAAAMLNVIDIVRKRKQKVLVVSSACAGMTNLLLEAAQKAGARDEKSAKKLITSIEKHHLAIAETLITDEDRLAKTYAQIEQYCDDLRSLSHGMAILGECSPRSLDAFASYGEMLSTTVLAAGFEEREPDALLEDVRKYMVTDDAFTKAQPDIPEMTTRVTSELLPLFTKHKIIITQGFIGATPDGIRTTIGRGGSDYSAALLGVAANAKEIQIWTDVNGVLTADPRLVPHAQNIAALTFHEASELAYFGAKVLHPETIKPAVDKNIPVRVLNSRQPDHPGTLILREIQEQDSVGVKSIASKKDITLLNITSTRMFLAHDYIKAVFDIFEKYETIVHLIASSEVTISVTFEDTSHLDQIIEELQRFAQVKMVPKRAIICAVGEDLTPTPGIVGKLFSSISNINVQMISQGASETNISFVIDEQDVEKAVQQIHKAFFE
ncbi:MAG TPA: lysine-sensitive aspartokinase 3 [Candidatus Kapabacteria bacterium]|nr:lysine-sensitive aspartokinase 3 [Candidatus Kapabacteria bacterium]